MPSQLLRRITCSFVVGAAFPVAAYAQAATRSGPDSVRAAIDRIFSPWVSTDAPGCAVGVAREGQLVHENGYGMANLETSTPITAGSVFHVASVSKQFTAASVMLLAQDGRLSLDDDIRKHLPELPDYGHRITIRHLLTHTSGLRDQWDLLYMARGRFEENRITNADVLEIVARQKALNFVPGTEWLYSNTGYTLAGIIVQRVSGKSLRDFAEERIFRPLGMTQTQFQDDYTRVIPGRAAGYARRATTGRWHVSLPNFDTYGATSLFTTVGDLLRWQANFDRLTVGSVETFNAMTAPWTLANRDTVTYGLGIVTERHRGTTVVGHSGSDAGYRAWLGRVPEHRLDIAVLCNAASANPAAIGRSVADVFLPATLKAPELPPAVRVAVDPATLRDLPGAYVNATSGAPMLITLRGDTLIMGQSSGPALIPVGARRFRVTGQPRELEFTRDGRFLDHRPLQWPARAPEAWERRPVAQPTPAVLATYAGTYYSAELGATYTVAVRDSALVMSTRWGSDVVVRPTYADAFLGGPFTVRFTRKAGKVDGMLMTTGRVRNVRFDRAATSGR